MVQQLPTQCRYFQIHRAYILISTRLQHVTWSFPSNKIHVWFLFNQTYDSSGHVFSHHPKYLTVFKNLFLKLPLVQHSFHPPILHPILLIIQLYLFKDAFTSRLYQISLLYMIRFTVLFPFISHGLSSYLCCYLECLPHSMRDCFCIAHHFTVRAWQLVDTQYVLVEWINEFMSKLQSHTLRNDIPHLSSHSDWQIPFLNLRLLLLMPFIYPKESQIHRIQ